VVDHAKADGIGIIVIDQNGGLKQNVDIGHISNQKFILMTFNTLISMIRCKAEEERITTKVIDESYTGKASFLGNEPV
jgi:putative transposase